MTRRSWAVYGMLVAIWATLIGWQTAEHLRARKAFHDMLINRGRSISTTCGLLMRTRSFFGVVNKERLEAALNELVHSYTNELRAVELLNGAGYVIAAAGPPIEMPPTNEFDGAVFWGGPIAILQNPIDLGTNMAELVMARDEARSLAPTPPNGDTNMPPERPPNLTNIDLSRPPGGPPRRRDFFDWRRGGRPSWMTEQDYKTLIEKKGAHSFVLVMPTQFVEIAENYDLWMRVIIAMLGTAAVVGYGFGWRNWTRTSELQLRLVRASEQNLHLKEMNLAAAGLAHETRNPLNIIRGMAQLISKIQDSSPEVRAKSLEIITETDRVTAQLNEFINYSRPREVRRATTDLNAVATEVARALNYDIEEKKIQLEVLVESLVIEADEQLLRQALFNLVLNAIQAVPAQGVIRIRASRRNHEEAFIEVSDNGPGVPPEQRAEIFKPYFTTHEEGTGLGLAVVQQIVLAHGWEIECVANELKGALFRISHVKLKMKE
jgi:signal transduction histidine kinase